MTQPTQITKEYGWAAGSGAREPIESGGTVGQFTIAEGWAAVTSEPAAGRLALDSYFASIKWIIANPTAAFEVFQAAYPNLFATGVFPARVDFNGVIKAITRTLKFLNQGGVFLWNAAFSATGGYPVGARVRKATGAGAWVNLVDGNSTDPDNGGTGWGSDVVLAAGATNDSLLPQRTYHDVTTGRAAGTNYTNSTTHEMEVRIIYDHFGVSQSISAYVGDVQVHQFAIASGSNAVELAGTFSFAVPSGAQYRVVMAGASGNIAGWQEFR
jgi:hypothetical protein